MVVGAQNIVPLRPFRKIYIFLNDEFYHFHMKYLPVFFIVVFLSYFPYNDVAAQSTQELLKQMHSSVVEKIDGKEFYIHTIKRGQTLYMISKAYGVEVNDLIRENPQVREGIKADQKIKIPVVGQKSGESTTPKPAKGQNVDGHAINKPLDSSKVAKISRPDSVVLIELPCGKDSTSKKAIYKVALMLPLFLSDVDHLNADNPDPKILETSRSFQFLPFYEGFRIALDSLEKTGLKIKLYVYDVDKDTTKTKLLLRRPEMKTMDLMFGLLYHRNFQIVAEFAKKNKINIVNPVSERSDLVNGNPYVFKVQPSKKVELTELAGFMSQTFNQGQVLIIRSGQYSDRDAPDLLKKECQERGLNVQIVDGQEAAISRLSKDKENYLVVFTDNTAYAFDLTRRLFELRNEYNLTLVGLPDWSLMDGLETEYLVALKTHLITASFIDYDDLFVKKFVRQYHSTYHADPVLLGFQGFDMAFYFLSALNNYGATMQRCLGDLHVNTLQSQFDFHQGKGNGFENQHWVVYKYENYRLVKVH